MIAVVAEAVAARCCMERYIAFFDGVEVLKIFPLVVDELSLVNIARFCTTQEYVVRSKHEKIS
jgi:hypothetical protein